MIEQITKYAIGILNDGLYAYRGDTFLPYIWD